MLKKKTVYILLIAFLASVIMPISVRAKTDGKKATGDKNFPSLLNNSFDAPLLKVQSDSLYNLMGLGNYGLQREVFFKAYKGYNFLLKKGLVRKKNILTVCDYSQSSNNKRLYVIDLKETRMLFNTFVSHGKNSGGEFANTFSNLVESNKSSLGFMLTAETYNGKAGYSMRFDGMEAGINDKVRTRDIVLHGSNFVNAQMVEARGIIGNSLGCPAIPNDKRNQVIEAIKGGSCFYIHHPDNWYNTTSTIINASFDIALVVQPSAIASQLTGPDHTTLANSTNTGL